MSFTVSVDGQVIPNNGIVSNIVVGIPPTPGSINTDFAIGTGTDSGVFDIDFVGNDPVLSGDFSSVNLQNGVNPAMFKNVAVINSGGDVNSRFTGASSGANGRVRVWKKLASGKYVIGGDFSAFAGVVCNRFAVLNEDFSVDAVTMALLGTAFNTSVFDIQQQSDGKVIVVGGFSSLNGVSYNRIVRFNTDWSVDTTFSSNLGTGPSGGAGTVTTCAIQSDDKIVFAGAFTSFAGNTTNYRRIVRRNSDGTTDATWTPGTAFSSGQVNQIKLQSDGKIICVGTFTSFNATTRQRVCRLLTTGAIDTTFGTTSGANTTVNSVEIDSTGLVYIVGGFLTYAGSSAIKIARLTTLGALDATYVTGTGFSGTASWICKNSSDDKMLVSCDATGTYNGTSVKGLVRLDTSGGIDSLFGLGFDQATTYVNVLSGDIMLVGGSLFKKYNGMFAANGNLLNKLAMVSRYGSLKTGLPKGQGFGFIYNTVVYGNEILVATSSYDGVTTYPGLIKFNLLGDIDTTFQTNIGTGGEATNFVYDSAGKILVVGSFTGFNGTSASRIIRLNNDGTIDGSFNSGTGFDGVPTKLFQQSDGKYMVLGGFANYDGVAKSGVCRLNNDGTLDTSFTPDAILATYDSISNFVQTPYGYVVTANNTFTFEAVIFSLNNSGVMQWTYGVYAIGSNGILGLAVKNNYLYYGGSFIHFSPATGNSIGCLDLSTGTWVDAGFGDGIDTNGFISTMAIQGNRLYVGGTFQFYKGVSANNIVCINI